MRYFIKNNDIKNERISINPLNSSRDGISVFIYLYLNAGAFA